MTSYASQTHSLTYKCKHINSRNTLNGLLCRCLGAKLRLQASSMVQLIQKSTETTHLRASKYNSQIRSKSRGASAWQKPSSKSWLAWDPWDNNIGRLTKYKFGLMECTPTAMIWDIKRELYLGCHFVAIEYHRRNAEALTHSLNHCTARHKNVTKGTTYIPSEELQSRGTGAPSAIWTSFLASQALSCLHHGHVNCWALKFLRHFSPYSALQLSEEMKWISSLTLSNHMTSRFL